MILILISLFLNSAEARNSCYTTDHCLVRITNCRMSDYPFEIIEDINFYELGILNSNVVKGITKLSWSMRKTTVCHSKYGGYPSSHSGTYSDQTNFAEFSVLDTLRVPDTIEEVPAKNKSELRRMKKCNEYRRDLLATYPRCN